MSLVQDILVQLGRRLVEVRFFHGHIYPAIKLGVDIVHNFQMVYGTSYPSTVDSFSLSSSMYVATGDGAAVMTVIGNASQLKLPDMIEPTAKVDPSHCVHSFVWLFETLDIPHSLGYYRR